MCGLCVIALRAPKGQVWTRHFAPAAPAFKQPSLPSQFLAYVTGQYLFHWLNVLLPILPGLAWPEGEQGGGGGAVATSL